MRTPPPQPVGVSARHTSVPAPTALEADPAARAHLIVAATGNPAVEQLVKTLQAQAAHSSVEVLVASDDGEAELEEQLRTRLERATVGLRLYVAGSESLVRRAAALALACGLERDELRTQVTASPARRVWCTHCKTITPAVTTTIARCDGCARMLEVYHHFSRRHGAYMGYQADAEMPGELPEPEVRWA